MCLRSVFPSAISQDLAKRFSLFLGMDLVRVRYQVVALHRCARTQTHTHTYLHTQCSFSRTCQVSEVLGSCIHTYILCVDVRIE